MIQGATLAAGIADCGDIRWLVGAHDNLCDLVRSDCPNMFQMGALPGLHCPLKLLRHRFGAQGLAGRNRLSDGRQAYGGHGE